MKFGHIAGDSMLDLLNTVAWRLGGPDRAEQLRTFDDVIDWCAESGLLNEGEAATLRTLAVQDAAEAERERLAVIAAREKAYAALFERDAAATADLAALYRAALTEADLLHDGNRWHWRERRTTLRVPRDRIIRGLIDFARNADVSRLHQCEDAKCGWLYLDTSPRRNRRWCNTKDCGDRNRARAYYARQKAKSQEG